MTYLLGLTGSIGMGKTTTATFFAEAGVPVWDADAAVARLYAKGGAAVPSMASAFPRSIVDGAVSKPALKPLIASDPAALSIIEGIVHPLVAEDRQAFIDGATADVLLFDIPLLYETGADQWLDGVVVVTTDPDTQRRRVLDRGTMTEDEFDLILARQVPDVEKRARADFIIRTDTMEAARASVLEVLSQIKEAQNA